MRLFLLRLSILAFALLGLILMVNFRKLGWYHPLSISLLFFFVSITMLTGWVGWKGMQKDPESAISYLLSAMGLHFMLCLIGVAIAIIAITGYDLLFTGWFFSLYILFTCFVVWSLMTTLRPHLRQTKSSDK